LHRCVKSSASSVALALAIGALGAVGMTGIASAAQQAQSVANAALAQSLPDDPPPPPPHMFRAKFNTLQECQARAGQEHPGRPGDWDCRRGPDPNNPWEYWGV
jgi:hypothetical protein